MTCFDATILDITKIMTRRDILLDYSVWSTADGGQGRTGGSRSRYGYLHVDLYFVINIVTNHNS